MSHTLEQVTCPKCGQQFHTIFSTHQKVEDLTNALKDLLAWSNILDHHSEQAQQVRDNARAALDN